MKVLNLIKDVLQLNLCNLAILNTSPRLASIRKIAYKTHNKRWRYNPLTGFLVFHWRLLTQLIYLRPNQASPPPGQILVFITTVNQYRALAPVIAHLNEAVYITDPYGQPLPDAIAQSWLPARFWWYLWAYPCLPLLLYQWAMAPAGYERQSFWLFADFYWRMYGQYITYRFWFWKLQPTALLLANDHVEVPRVLNKAARDAHIPTFYLQHASVGDDFPPLDFDYALLEGYDALAKYDKAGPSDTRVFLVGMPRFDAYQTMVNTCPTVQRVGICINALDPMDKAEALVTTLISHLPPEQLYLRPHPSDPRQAAWQHLAQNYRLHFSNARTESSFEFFQKVDAIIAGDSSIHLEAALVNIYPIYYSFSGTPLDRYGYQVNGLVEFISEPSQVAHRLQELAQAKPDVRSATKYYCATMNTTYSGYSAGLAASIIQAVATANSINMSLWQRIPDIHLESYELNPAHEQGSS